MRSTMIILVVAAGLVAFVNSLPLLQNDNYNPVTLDQLTMVDDNNETSHRSKRTIGILRQIFPDFSKNVYQGTYLAPRDMDVAASENNEVRVAFEDIQPAANEAVESELTPLDDIEVNDEENRNKRLVSLGGNSGGGDGGSSGGSGNFLFDIIRLVAGSGSQSTDGQPSTGKSPEMDEAVPGPATRLLVIANRGISNLIQDLILRIAATTERFVNFKARLITSII